METEFRQIVKLASEVAAVNWGNPNTNAPFPQISLSPIGEAGQQTMEGRIKSSRECGVQVDIWHTDYASLIALKNKVVTLDCFTGSGVVTNIMQNGIRYGTDTTAVGNVVYRYSIDFRVFYRE